MMIQLETFKINYTSKLHTETFKTILIHTVKDLIFAGKKFYENEDIDDFTS